MGEGAEGGGTHQTRPPPAHAEAEPTRSRAARRPRAYKPTENNKLTSQKKKTTEKVCRAGERAGRAPAQAEPPRSAGAAGASGEHGDADGRGGPDRGGDPAVPSAVGRWRQRGRVGGRGARAHLRLLPQGDPRGAGADARRGGAARDDGARGRGRGRSGPRGALPLPLRRLQAPLPRRGRGTCGSGPARPAILLSLVAFLFRWFGTEIVAATSYEPAESCWLGGGRG